MIQADTQSVLSYWPIFWSYYSLGQSQ